MFYSNNNDTTVNSRLLPGFGEPELTLSNNNKTVSNTTVTYCSVIISE